MDMPVWICKVQRRLSGEFIMDKIIIISRLYRCMSTKLCVNCKHVFLVEKFHLIKKEKRYTSWCRSCLYTYQKNRWKDRKHKAIELKGGACAICGYNKNYAAMEFHHLDPKEKELDWKKLRQVKWEFIVTELQKCTLLCSNCHREVHNPDASIKQVAPPPALSCEMKSTGKCPSCKTKTFGTKFCSVACCSLFKRKITRPSRAELAELIATMPMVRIGKKFGVSDNAIRKWAKCYDLL